MTHLTWLQCARICDDPYRYHYTWLPLHDALGIVPGDKIPQGGLTCPEAMALGWLSMARRFPQQRFRIPGGWPIKPLRRKVGVNWIG
jgi:hypothetical protein